MTTIHTSSHSYYPVGVYLPNYAPNEWSTLALVLTFAVVWVAVVCAARTFATKVNPSISITELIKVCWFAQCGAIHSLLEGYYALNFSSLQGSQSILAQLWKEYSLSDSRYLTSHAFVMTMESVTAWAWGPLSLLLVLLIVKDSPYRHPLQLIISLGQLYGDVLYLGTAAFDYLVFGQEYSRPEGYYFFGYFVGLNGIWIVVPSLLIADSVRACARAFGELKRVKRDKVKGDAKKLS
ncbi:Emopamil-binding protein [Aspergillus unguis]